MLKSYDGQNLIEGMTVYQSEVRTNQIQILSPVIISINEDEKLVELEIKGDTKDSKYRRTWKTQPESVHTNKRALAEIYLTNQYKLMSKVIPSNISYLEGVIEEELRGEVTLEKVTYNATVQEGLQNLEI